MEESDEYLIYAYGSGRWTLLASAPAIPAAYTIAYYHAALYNERVEVARKGSDKHTQISKRPTVARLPTKFKTTV